MVDITLLDKPGNREALDLWHSVTAEVLRDGVDLSARQMAMLLSVYKAKEPVTVKYLSQQLFVPKAAVSRGLDALSKKGFIERSVDPTDRRNVIVLPTEDGAFFLANFSETVMQKIGEM